MKSDYLFAVCCVLPGLAVVASGSVPALPWAAHEPEPQVPGFPEVALDCLHTLRVCVMRDLVYTDMQLRGRVVDN